MKNDVLITAVIEHIEADPTQYKMYRTTLGFEGKVFVQVPVPASEVTKKGDQYILTLAGLKSFLNTYTKMVEELHSQYLNSYK